jgi:hypothetical protein
MSKKNPDLQYLVECAPACVLVRPTDDLLYSLLGLRQCLSRGRASLRRQKHPMGSVFFKRLDM